MKALIKKEFANAVGFNIDFVQDNYSKSRKNVLRGLHYQIEHTQAKLTRVINGEVFDVAVDLRRSSPTFGKYVCTILSAENRRSMWIPPGFAHGFLVLSEYAEFTYKVSDYWAPNKARVISWSDPDINVPWPINTPPVLSLKDQTGELLKNAETF